MHTPGPWQLVTSCDGTPSVGIPVGEGYGSGFVIAHCNRPSFKNGAAGSVEANARLIAAAPEMLEALQGLVAACEYVRPIAGAVAVEASVKNIRQAGKFMEAVETARAAIAKALLIAG